MQILPSPALNRETDPTSLRLDFDGMKGRDWLMKWLPARAYDNGIYAVFSNAIGMDDDQVRNGCSMIMTLLEIFWPNAEHSAMIS